MAEYTKNIQALNNSQKCWFRNIDSYAVHILEGPAGTGKSYCATAEGCARLDKGTTDRMVFIRPHVTTEDFGFLPGDIEEKMDPFMLPLIDVSVSRLSMKRYKQYKENGQIEIAPIAYLRGRTFHRSWMILDEAQNCTPAQMKMVLTRIGDNTKLIITGDLTQSDLEGKNGLEWLVKTFAGCPVMNTISFVNEDIVRSSTVKEILQWMKP